MKAWLVGACVISMGGSVALLACEEDSTSSGGIDVDAGSSSGASGSSGTSGPGTPPAPGGGKAFCDKTLGVVVGALEACCTAEDKATQDYNFTHGIATRLLPVCSDTLEASITKSRVVYHADKAEACFAAYQTTYGPGKCPNITQTFSDPAGTACREAYSGAGAAGAPCMGDHECVDGLTCVGYTGSSDGACKTPPAIGEDCGPAKTDASTGGAASLEFGAHPPCAQGARCDTFTRKCVKAVASGEDCTSSELCEAGLRCHLGKCGATGPSEANGPCLDRDDCKPDLYCEKADAGQGTCKPKKAAGGTCTGAAFVSECIGRCNAPVGQPGTCASFCGSP